MDSETHSYGDLEFPFGKYKGYMLWEVVDSEPSYIDWWLKNVTNHVEFNAKVRKYFKAKLPNGY